MRRGATRRPPAAAALGGRVERPPAPPRGDRACGRRAPASPRRLAGLACLLLAMGIGVLIGRSGATIRPRPRRSRSPARPGSLRCGRDPAAAFTSDWKPGGPRWTIALDSLPKDVHAARRRGRRQGGRAARAPTAVGALDSDDYSTLTGGPTSSTPGVRHEVRDEGAGAAGGEVRRRARRPCRTAKAAAASDTTAGEVQAHGEDVGGRRRQGASGHEEGLRGPKKAPTTVGTGGKAPPKDNKPAANGAGFQEIG